MQVVVVGEGASPVVKRRWPIDDRSAYLVVFQRNNEHTYGPR